MSTDKQESSLTNPDRAAAGEVPTTENPQITHCPACSRKLLTQSSALCNWCGAKINDPKYQALAAESRQLRDQNERRQIESVVQEESRYGILGRLKRRAKQKPDDPPLLG